MIEPGDTLGLLGGGQLGRMFTLRAREMGYEVVVLEPDPSSPAGAVATRHIRANYDDQAALADLARSARAVTTEFENVPAQALAWLADRIPCRPGPEAVATTQNRIAEKTFLKAIGLSTADFDAVASLADVDAAWRRLGGPALLKTSQFGYDGKGQASIATREQAVAAFERFGSVPCVYERRLTLEQEISVVLARDSTGAVAVFPIGENVHRDGILHTTVAPARIDARLALAAEHAARQVAEGLRYEGVLAVEMFVADGGQLSVNEIAPRPHNSGHYTQDACATCQFEQQVRVLAGLPLGDPRLLSPVCMINLLGDVWPAADRQPRWERALTLPGVRLHLYGKKAVRAGRKMGHLNCLAETADQALVLAERAYGSLRPA